MLLYICFQFTWGFGWFLDTFSFREAEDAGVEVETFEPKLSVEGVPGQVVCFKATFVKGSESIELNRLLLVLLPLTFPWDPEFVTDKQWVVAILDTMNNYYQIYLARCLCLCTEVANRRLQSIKFRALSCPARFVLVE